MKLFLTALMLSLAAPGGPLSAQSTPVVVELFTSQGCSSCPPADKLLDELARRPDVIALSLHVEYWDYIGWKDEFADPRNTKRQKAYASLAGRRMIYTPQMIVNGQDDVVGARSFELAELIMKHQDDPLVAGISARRAGDELVVHITPADRAIGGAMDVHLVRFSPSESVTVTRGENAGRVLDYANVVREWTVLGQWNGKEPLELRNPFTGDRPAVILLQRTGTGPILAAAHVE